MVPPLRQMRSAIDRYRFLVPARPSVSGVVDVAPQSCAQLSFSRPAICGLLASTSIVVGSVIGGGTFISVDPGAWFFGTQSTLSENGTVPSGHASLASILLVYGGLILLTRTWFVCLRMLRANRGVPVRRAVALMA